jgi:hypothetical protein
VAEELFDGDQWDAALDEQGTRQFTEDTAFEDGSRWEGLAELMLGSK